MIKTRAVIPKVNWKETTSFIKQCSPTESYFYEDRTLCLILYILALGEKISLIKVSLHEIRIHSSSL